MITRLEIDNYKCIAHEDLNLKPLTIVTGLNSTGKSTLINSVLLVEQESKGIKLGLSSLFEVIRCRYNNADRVTIRVRYSDGPTRMLEVLPDQKNWLHPESTPTLEDGIYYLSANRIGAEEQVTFSGRHAIGPKGENIFSTFELEKSEPVVESLRKYTESYTLQHQVNGWLSYILGFPMRLITEKVSEEIVTVKYESDGITNISPKNLGAGVSYLVKVLIMCLRSKVDNILLIENPEIHLHPSAQAKLGEFLAYIAASGIQIIVETHCEHLINRVQYAIYKNELNHEDALLLYKGGISKSFQQIEFRQGGEFSVQFPDGFFDATLAELIEMG